MLEPHYNSSMKTAITPEAMTIYRRSAQARDLAQQREREQRRQVARVLKERFGATQVIAFGSFAHGAWFGLHSDIDLAVEGIPPAAFWRAWAALDRLGPSFEIDLVALESAMEPLRAEIAMQGVAL